MRITFKPLSLNQVIETNDILTIKWQPQTDKLLERKNERRHPSYDCNYLSSDEKNKLQIILAYIFRTSDGWPFDHFDARSRRGGDHIIRDNTPNYPPPWTVEPSHVQTESDLFQVRMIAYCFKSSLVSSNANGSQRNSQVNEHTISSSGSLVLWIVASTTHGLLQYVPFSLP